VFWLKVLANLGHKLGAGAIGFQLIQKGVGVFDGHLKILVTSFFVAQQVRRESDFWSAHPEASDAKGSRAAKTTHLAGRDWCEVYVGRPIATTKRPCLFFSIFNGSDVHQI